MYALRACFAENMVLGSTADCAALFEWGKSERAVKTGVTVETGIKVETEVTVETGVTEETGATV